MVNWNSLLKSQRLNVEDFASGNLSARELTRAVVHTNVAGEVRRLLRNNGVDKARRLARKALERRT
jgi:hypothetical protein